jgi:hypothetical protein
MTLKVEEKGKKPDFKKQPLSIILGKLFYVHFVTLACLYF